MVADSSRAAHIPPWCTGPALDICDRKAGARGRLPPDATHHVARDCDGHGHLSGSASVHRGSSSRSHVRHTYRSPTPSPTGSRDDVEGWRAKPGRDSSCHIIYRGRRETESPPRLQATAESITNPNRGEGER